MALQRFARNTLHSTLAGASTALGAFLSVVVVARILGPGGAKLRPGIPDDDRRGGRAPGLPFGRVHLQRSGNFCGVLDRRRGRLPRMWT